MFLANFNKAKFLVKLGCYNDLNLIENLRKDHDKSSKAVEDLRHNNADLAKTVSSKEQKIRDLERALAERREASGKDISEIINKLRLLFKEYEKSLMDFGVRPAPLPADISLADFMRWIETEFKALPEVITGASDFATSFSVKSILKLLHDFDCADLVKFREKLPQFPDASSILMMFLRWSLHKKVFLLGLSYDSTFLTSILQVLKMSSWHWLLFRCCC
jgi:seryl-tRNA synthetase